MERFAKVTKAERNKVRFLYFNHTNPVVGTNSPEARNVRDFGHHVAAEGERIGLYAEEFMQ